MNQKTIFIAVAGILVLAFLMATMIYRNYQATVQDGATSQNQAIVERQGAATKGPADAKVTVVEFLDPACGTCRDFLPYVKQLISQYPGQVRVMVRYAPLHPGSDQVVKMLEAAHQQGKFWQALEILFNNQDRWVINHNSQPMRALNILNSLDIDQEKLAADMNRPEIAQTVEQDVQDGQTLNVRATPEFFVNGRPLPSFGIAQLNQLVKE
ncbi:MAG: thioredoxin domain-containing protein, partial [Gammaproteobacteria bacterium]|nr:thioredoxin domain-containing protein [Gammaproteobacteria bacterium]